MVAVRARRVLGGQSRIGCKNIGFELTEAPKETEESSLCQTEITESVSSSWHMRICHKHQPRK